MDKPLSSSSKNGVRGKHEGAVRRQLLPEEQGAPHNSQQDKDLTSQSPAPLYTHRVNRAGSGAPSAFRHKAR